MRAYIYIYIYIYTHIRIVYMLRIVHYKYMALAKKTPVSPNSTLLFVEPSRSAADHLIIVRIAKWCMKFCRLYIYIYMYIYIYIYIYTYVYIHIYIYIYMYICCAPQSTRTFFEAVSKNMYFRLSVRNSLQYLRTSTSTFVELRAREPAMMISDLFPSRSK